MQHKISEFQQLVWAHYAHKSRELLWRQTDRNGGFDPYKILVSEIMLQQTQVSRVTQKYVDFLQAFPDVDTLANATLGDVLVEWQGLGYNRRAKFLWQSAQMIRDDYRGIFPHDIKELIKLPGVGANTAGAIAAYAYNQPAVFIETNIRTVYIHHFFADRENVHDKELLPTVEETLDKEHPREWYWALMDYGSSLKKNAGNVSRRSKHYVKQSTFSGSNRQLRGAVLRKLARSKDWLTVVALEIDDERLQSVLDQLTQEGMIVQKQSTYHLA